MTIEGGIVQDVSTFGVAADVMILDLDTEGAPYEDTEQIDPDDEDARAFVTVWRPRDPFDGIDKSRLPAILRLFDRETQRDPA